MKTLILTPSRTNPYVCLDPITKKYQISGKSYPEDPQAIYEPIANWFKMNVPQLDHKLELTVQTDYFNSTSNRFLLKILRSLEHYNKEGKDIEIIWNYDDEEIQYNGILFSHLVNLPFRFIYKPITD
jgi:hypothetical protein